MPMNSVPIHRQYYLGVGGVELFGGSVQHSDPDRGGWGLELFGGSIPHSDPDRRSGLRLGKVSLYATPNLPPPK